MKKSIRDDLEVVCDAIEHLRSRIDSMPIFEQVDVGARVSAIVKSSRELSELISGEIKKHLKHTPGDVNGEQFRAHLHVGDVHRLDQKALKENDPETHEKWCKDVTQETVTYRPRG